MNCYHCDAQLDEALCEADGWWRCLKCGAERCAVCGYDHCYASSFAEWRDIQRAHETDEAEP